MEDRELYLQTLKVFQKISDYGPTIVNGLQVREKNPKDLWYRLKKVDEQKDSKILNKYKIALTEIISNNSCY